MESMILAKDWPPTTPMQPPSSKADPPDTCMPYISATEKFPPMKTQPPSRVDAHVAMVLFRNMLCA